MQHRNADALSAEKLRAFGLTDSAIRLISRALKDPADRQLTGAMTRLLILRSMLRSEQRLGLCIIELNNINCSELETDIDTLISVVNETVDAPINRQDFGEVEQLIAMAMAEATAIGVNYVGTEHLLLAICQSGQDDLKRILEKHMLTYNNCRNILVNILEQG